MDGSRCVFTAGMRLHQSEHETEVQQTMGARMKNPTVIIPEAMEPIKAILGATYRGGVAPTTLALVHPRASQINGCHAWIRGGCYDQRSGESLDWLFAVSA